MSVFQRLNSNFIYDCNQCQKAMLITRHHFIRDLSLTICGVCMQIAFFSCVVKIELLSLTFCGFKFFFLSYSRLMSFIHFCFLFAAATTTVNSSTMTMMRQLLGVIAFATIAIMLMQIPSSTACMCMPTHSQSSYCNSDYGK